MVKSKKIHILLLSLFFTSSLQAFSFDSIRDAINGWLGTVLTAVSTAIITNFLLEKYVKPAIIAPPAARHIDVFALPVAQAQFPNTPRILKNASRFIGSRHEEVDTAIDSIKNPTKYANIKPVRSIMLYGQSGIGKSAYAHAIYDMIGKSVLWECSGANLQKCTADHIHAMFAFARRVTADFSSDFRIVIFIDDMHLFNAVVSDSKKEATRKREVLAALSEELEHVDNTHILFIGASQLPATQLEFTKLYAKSIDRAIEMQLPNLNDRIEVLKLWVQKQTIKIDDAALQNIAQKTEKYTYRELKGLFDKLVSSAIKRNKESVEIQDIGQLKIANA